MAHDSEEIIKICCSACKHVSGLNGFYRQIHLISRCYRNRLEFRTFWMKFGLRGNLICANQKHLITIESQRECGMSPDDRVQCDVCLVPYAKIVKFVFIATASPAWSLTAFSDCAYQHIRNGGGGGGGMESQKDIIITYEKHEDKDCCHDIGIGTTRKWQSAVIISVFYTRLNTYKRIIENKPSEWMWLATIELGN